MSTRHLRWPSKEPGTTRTYSLDLSQDLPGVPLKQVSAQLSPSGTGEMAINSISVDASMVNLVFAGGVAGRSHLVKIDVTPQGLPVVEYVAFIYIDRAMASWPIPNPPASGFGAAVTWNFVVSTDYSKPQNIWFM